MSSGFLKWGRTISFLMVGVLCFPPLVFLFNIPFIRFPTDTEWIKVLILTIVQATLSAGGAVVVGLVGALGLVTCQKLKRGAEVFCLLPTFLPALVCVPAWMSLWEHTGARVPFNFFMVVGVHVLIHAPLLSVFIACMLRLQTRGLAAWAFVHGISKWGFLKKILFSNGLKDLTLIFLLVFAFCFTSFSVPLLVGGKSGQTLEVLIASKLKHPQQWPQAMALFSMEALFLFLFFMALYRLPPGKTLKTFPWAESLSSPHEASSFPRKRESTSHNQQDITPPVQASSPPDTVSSPHETSSPPHEASSFPRKRESTPHPFLYDMLPGGKVLSKVFLAEAFLPSVLLVGGLFHNLFSPRAWEGVFHIAALLPAVVARTLLLGLGVGGFCFVLLCGVSFTAQIRWFRKFLLSYYACSVALTGFAFLGLGSEGALWTGFRWVGGLSLLLFPLLYRVMGESLLNKLNSPIQVALLMGAGPGLIFTHIIWPLCLKPFLFLSGLAAFWATGDFTYSALVSYSGPGHLALLIQDVFATYRFELASLLVILLMITGGGCFLFFLSLQHLRWPAKIRGRIFKTIPARGTHHHV